MVAIEDMGVGVQQQLVDQEGRPVVGQRIRVDQQTLQGSGSGRVNGKSRSSRPLVVRLIQTAKFRHQAGTNGASARRRRFGELAGDKSLVSVKLDGGQIGLQS